MSTPQRLADLAEDDLLAEILPALAGRTGPDVVLGPGDDAAVVRPAAAQILTTDSMVRGHDWRDDWSSGADVGHKVIAQNLADVAAMGGRSTGVLISLMADPQTTLDWVRDLMEGIDSACAAAGVSVLGGDLSAAPGGVVIVSVTAVGTLEDRTPVSRAGARPGHVLAVCGTLGLSGAGLRLLADGRSADDPVAVAVHRRPIPPLPAGPQAALAGATSMIDVSDGLARDLPRLARASGVAIHLDSVALLPFVARLAPAIGWEAARSCVLGGGEEHSLVATFATLPPPGWLPIGRCAEGEGVWLDGERLPAGGWDHFAGAS